MLVREPGTSKPTPWHQDSPYYLVDGEQTISFWSPMDPVTDASLCCVVGSHRWEKPVLPTRYTPNVLVIFQLDTVSLYQPKNKKVYGRACRSTR